MKGPGKGKTNNPNGKPPGTKSRKTIEWELIGHELKTKNVARVKKIMKKADDETFMRYFFQLLEYFQPKLARTEITGKESEPIQIIYQKGEAGND